jgi:hypothetical protein
MKNLFLFLSLFILTISYAETKPTTKIIVRDKCDIIYENTYKYCIDHGESKESASAIAAAAKCACRDLRIVDNGLN